MASKTMILSFEKIFWNRRLFWRLYTTGFETVAVLRTSLSFATDARSAEPNFLLDWIAIFTFFFFQPDFIVIHFDFSLTYTQTSTFYIAQTLIQTKIFVFLNVNIRCIWTFSAVWLFTKIAYACAKKYLSSSLTFRYWKCFVWDNHRKLKHYLEITTEMNEMTTGLGCHPSEKHSHYLQNVLFFSLDWAYFSLCDKSYQGEAFQCS